MEQNNKKEGYKVPHRYFDRSKDHTLSSISRLAKSEAKAESKRSTSTVRTLWLKYGAVAASLIIGFVIYDQNNHTYPVTPDQDLSVAYLDYLIDNTDILSMEDLSLFDDVMLDDVTEDEELLEYLEELDTEDIMSIM